MIVTTIYKLSNQLLKIIKKYLMCSAFNILIEMYLTLFYSNPDHPRLYRCSVGGRSNEVGG